MADPNYSYIRMKFDGANATYSFGTIAKDGTLKETQKFTSGYKPEKFSEFTKDLPPGLASFSNAAIFSLAKEGQRQQLLAFEQLAGHPIDFKDSTKVNSVFLFGKDNKDAIALLDHTATPDLDKAKVAAGTLAAWAASQDPQQISSLAEWRAYKKGSGTAALPTAKGLEDAYRKAQEAARKAGTERRIENFEQETEDRKAGYADETQRRREKHEAEVEARKARRSRSLDRTY